MQISCEFIWWITHHEKSFLDVQVCKKMVRLNECSFQAEGMRSEGGMDAPLPLADPMKIIHKDQDMILSFCINQVSHQWILIRWIGWLRWLKSPVMWPRYVPIVFLCLCVWYLKWYFRRTKATGLEKFATWIKVLAIHLPRFLVLACVSYLCIVMWFVHFNSRCCT